MANGSHAELVSVPAGVWPFPDGLDIIEAACVPVAFGTPTTAVRFGTPSR